jgi:hypothetical protein
MVIIPAAHARCPRCCVSVSKSIPLTALSQATGCGRARQRRQSGKRGRYFRFAKCGSNSFGGYSGASVEPASAPPDPAL